MAVTSAPGLQAVRSMDEVHDSLVRLVEVEGSFALDSRRGIARGIHRPEQRVAIE